MLFDGEEELFDIALTIVDLAVQRLSGCLSPYDAAACLSSLMALSMAAIALYNPCLFSAMDALAPIVRSSRARGIVMAHHSRLTASVLPGPGEVGQESSLLSL